MELWQLIARESIRDLVARYNAQGDSGRFDEMLKVFHPSAVMETPGHVYEGYSGIREMLEGAASRTLEGAGGNYVRHYTATHQIDLENEDRARGRSYYQVLTDRGLDHWGRYVDEYARFEGRWWIIRRNVSIDGRVKGSWSDLAKDTE